uniref:Uncharacterized protein n=1 Tax=Takifugu rubripes TaxID=31033 RepID=A0A674MR72_TAKRU
MNICFLLAFLHQMSAELHCDARIQSTTVGGSKPLHYFMKGQPKITGVRSCVWFCSRVFGSDLQHHQKNSKSTYCPLGVFLLRSHPQVTISLALTIVTILGIFWTILQIIPNIHFRLHGYTIHDIYDNVTETAMQWSEYHEVIAVVYLCYCLMCVVVFIVMSVLAGAALRSTKSQVRTNTQLKGVSGCQTLD